MTIPALSPYMPPMPAHDFIEGPWYLAWNLDIQYLIPVGVMGFLYARGLSRWPERSREHSRWRTASYYAGLLVLTLAFQSPLDRLGEHHFSLHIVQHSIVMMIVPPLILLGAPTTPVLRGLPRRVRQGIVAPALQDPGIQGLWNVLTHPVVVIVIFTLATWGWHLMPGWYDAALNDRFIHDLQHITFFTVGLLFWWNIVDPKPRRSRIPMGFRILYFYAAMIPKHFLAAMITFADTPFYPTYERVRLFLPNTPMEDQQLAGLLLWVPFGEGINLTVAGIIFAMWWRQADQNQRREEARRDAEAAAPAAGG